MMNRMFFALAMLCSVLLNGTAHASALDLARELHRELNTIDRETLPESFTVLVIQVLPGYQSKAPELRHIILTVLDSKEYEAIRADYFAKVFTEQQLREQIDLVRTPAFKLYQRKMLESAKFSSEALMSLVQKASAQSAESLKPSPQIVSCISLAEARNTFTPADLYKGVGECLSQNKFDMAAGLFALAGVYAKFDAERVADKTAGQIKTILIMDTFASLSQDKKDKFDETIAQITKNPESLEKLCRDVQRVGMPNYYPNYMILHGIRALSGNPNDDTLLKDFDSAQTWKTLQTEYLKCPG